MPNSQNSTRCVLCDSRLVKNGKTAAGTQRWRCPDCGAAATRKRPDVARRHQLEAFLSWLLGKLSQSEVSGTQTGRSFRRETAWCWRVTPQLPAVTSPPRFVLIDGTYIGTWCLLIAVDEHLKPLAVQWCSTESQAAWKALLQQVPPPRVVVCDGGTGIRAALHEVWPHTRVQRCLYHVWRNLRTHLTLKPRTPAAQALLKIGKQLAPITTVEDATAWLQRLNDWHQVYGHLTTERSYATERLSNGLWDSPTGKRWWYTHDRLRKAYKLLAGLQRQRQRQDHLFTHLTTGAPKTTSPLEGGINALIKSTLRLHRGMPEEHQKRAAEWVLFQRAKLLPTAHTLITSDAITPPQTKRPQHTEPDPGPELYGTGLDDTEGLWKRSGWAGRS